MRGFRRSTSALSIAIVGAVLVIAHPAPTLGQNPADEIVQELRGLPTPLQAEMRSDGSIVPTEQRRRESYERLRDLGDDARVAILQRCHEGEERDSVRRAYCLSRARFMCLKR